MIYSLPQNDCNSHVMENLTVTLHGKNMPGGGGGRDGLIPLFRLYFTFAKAWIMKKDISTGAFVWAGTHILITTCKMSFCFHVELPP